MHHPRGDPHRCERWGKCQRGAWCCLLTSLAIKHPYGPTSLDPCMPFRKTVNNVSRCCPLNLNNRSSLGRSLPHHSTWVRTLAPLRHQDSTAPNLCPGIPCHSPASPPPNSKTRANHASYHSSMPPPSRTSAPGTPPASSFVNQPSSANKFRPRQFEPTPEESG